MDAIRFSPSTSRHDALAHMEKKEDITDGYSVTVDKSVNHAAKNQQTFNCASNSLPTLREDRNFALQLLWLCLHDHLTAQHTETIQQYRMYVVSLLSAIASAPETLFSHLPSSVATWLLSRSPEDTHTHTFPLLLQNFVTACDLVLASFPGADCKHSVSGSLLLVLVLGAALYELQNTHKMLHESCRSDALGFVRVLVDVGVDIHARDVQGHTPLTAALTYANPAVAVLLIAAGVSVHVRSPTGYPALTLAAMCGDKETVEALLSAGADVEDDDVQGATALMWAVNKNHCDTARRLLSAGADVGVRSLLGGTALLLATAKRDVEMLQVLVRARALTEPRTGLGYTALLIAAEQGDTKAVRVLLDAGACVEARTNTHSTALMLAIQHGHTDVAVALLAAGADPDCQVRGVPALTYAMSRGDAATASVLRAAMKPAYERQKYVYEQRNEALLHAIRVHEGVHVVRDLLSQKADVHYSDNDGNTPLHVAVMHNHASAVHLFLNIFLTSASSRSHEHKGAPVAGVKASRKTRGCSEPLLESLVSHISPVDEMNKAGETPLMVAVVHSRHALVERLLAAKCTVNLCDNHSRAALQLAARSSCPSVVQALVEAKADVRAADKRGTTALLAAVSVGAAECVRILIEARAPVNVKNSVGQSVWDLARDDDIKEVLRLCGVPAFK